MVTFYKSDVKQGGSPIAEGVVAETEKDGEVVILTVTLPKVVDAILGIEGEGVAIQVDVED